MALRVRTVGEEGRTEVAALRRAWNEEQAGGPIEDPRFEDAFADWWAAEGATRTFFLVEVDGRPVGMANVKQYDRMPVAGAPSRTSCGYVGNVFVLSEHRDSGIGRQLMDEIVRWAGERGLGHLRLAPSPRSATFYERLGFTAGAVVELDP